MARFRSATVGMIFQSFNLIGSKAAFGNVELPMVFARRSPRERLAPAQKALEAVGLGARLYHRPDQMSEGESQRVAIARALVDRPRVVLAGEPTGNLDSHTARQVMVQILGHVRERAATLVLVTHGEEPAASCTDRVIRQADGRIAAEGI
jgi:putative ABC transport system ATP-binding protein